ncbi:formylglycine-generating enzyme family protein, partial [uncultured Odoribacter sp.]|uniref:formylglycine-generating enzyme family protein n=1 Tax=uncultured Odoribacter sp. TaxID=876416 RepID=UPI0026265EA8
LTGLDFKLPTESQWEYAARGGNKSRGNKYSGSNTLSEVGWYEGNSGGRTHPIGQKRANELGLYDMSGNVYEWCSDWYGGYNSSSETDPIGPGSGSLRVIRGGSCNFGAGICRVSYRGSFVPGDRLNYLGLRLAF